jgi:hypothetical protein
MKILKYIFIFVVLSLVIFLVLQTKIVNKGDTVPPQNIVVEIKQNVENYLRENISKLSPVKAVLGGTWYVVSITTDLGGKFGTVTYEDGHIQEIKNFSYTTNDKGEVVSLTIINSPVACTQEAKLCPDGSAVGRTGPNCEFSLCPDMGSTSKKSGITGTVTLGPTCPVERIPPDPNCAPKFYSTSINIMKTTSTVIVKTVQSDSKGVFYVDLAPGAYVLQAKGGNMLPRCGDVSAEVRSNQYTIANISCDTGIR